MFGKWTTGKGLNPTFQVFCARLRQGDEVIGLDFAVLRRSSAARAALRGASPLPHLFGASNACAFGARPLFVRLDIEPCAKGRAKMPQD